MITSHLHKLSANRGIQFLYVCVPHSPWRRISLFTGFMAGVFFKTGHARNAETQKADVQNADVQKVERWKRWTMKRTTSKTPNDRKAESNKTPKSKLSLNHAGIFTRNRYLYVIFASSLNNFRQHGPRGSDGMCTSTNLNYNKSRFNLLLWCFYLCVFICFCWLWYSPTVFLWPLLMNCNHVPITEPWLSATRAAGVVYLNAMVTW